MSSKAFTRQSKTGKFLKINLVQKGTLFEEKSINGLERVVSESCDKLSFRIHYTFLSNSFNYFVCLCGHKNHLSEKFCAIQSPLVFPQ